MTRLKDIHCNTLYNTACSGTFRVNCNKLFQFVQYSIGGTSWNHQKTLRILVLTSQTCRPTIPPARPRTSHRWRRARRSRPTGCWAWTARPPGPYVQTASHWWTTESTGKTEKTLWWLDNQTVYVFVFKRCTLVLARVLGCHLVTQIL